MSMIPKNSAAPAAASVEAHGAFGRICDEYQRALHAGEDPDVDRLLQEADQHVRPQLLEELSRLRRECRPPTGEARSDSHEASQSSTVLYQPPSNATPLRAVPGPEAASNRSSPPSLGRYELLELVGRGATGEVWRARDPELDRPVAVKVNLSNRLLPEFSRAQFLDEGRKLAKLKHPGIVTVYDVGCEGDRCYLVSDFIAGGTLEEQLRKQPVSPRDAAGLIATIAEALHAAHLQDIVHRDVKPSNVLMDERGRPLLTDFGLAVTEVEQMTEGPATVGTAAYMSPEQARGDSHHTDARSDIYSLGMVLYLMLTRRLPFVANNFPAYLDQILNREPRPPRTIDDSIPEELERICLKCLEKRPADRYSTAADVSRELRGWLDRTGEEAAVEASRSRRIKRRLRAAGWSAAAVCALTAAAVFGPRWISDDAPTHLSKETPILPGSTQGRQPLDVGSGERQSQDIDASVAAASTAAPDSLRSLAGDNFNLFKTYPLLQSEPKTLIGPLGPGQGKFYDPDAETVHVAYVGFGLFELGQCESQSYTFRGDFSQQGPWQGRAGLFFGLSPVAEDPLEQVGQLIIIGNNYDSKTNDEFPLTAIRYRLRLTEHVHTVYPCVTASYVEPLPWVRAGERSQLEIRIHKNRLQSVRWAGRPLNVLASRELNGCFSSEEYRGRFGLFVGRAAGVTFENAEIRIEKQ